MLYKMLVMVHLFGAAVWVGGHIVLMTVVLPLARRENNPGRILEFERGYGRVGLAALVLQLATGLWLADTWLGGWGNIFKEPTPSAHLVLTKLVLLAMTIALAGHAHARILPRLREGRMQAFTLHAGATTLVAILMLIVGASIRLGGLL